MFETFEYSPFLIFPENFRSNPITDNFEINALGELYQKKYAGKFIETSVKWVDETVGYGLFAERDIKQHEYVGEYTGKVEAISRFGRYNTDYYMKYPQKFWSWNYYIINSEHYGNESRFINHSYEPNLSIKAAQENGIMHVLFFANKFIPRGTQLFINYGKDYWSTRNPLPLS